MVIIILHRMLREIYDILKQMLGFTCLSKIIALLQYSNLSSPSTVYYQQSLEFVISAGRGDGDGVRRDE